MRTVRVELGPNSYDIRIGAGLLRQAGELVAALGFSGKTVVITDPTVRRRHGDALDRSLSAAGFSVATLTVPEGEAQKNLDNAVRLWEQLTEIGAERQTPVLALGGGVIGDLAGFVAATYLRGVPLIQVPTTLLAQVDSSLGGKTGVDHANLKNRIGVFYQPRLTIADTDVLSTLPAGEIANGLAEIIKTAAIRDRAFFTWLEDNIERIKALEISVLEEAIYRAASIKAAVVARDEKDLGLRHILNFGHTIGHAIESLSEFHIQHGQAVAIGMYAAARLSNFMELLSADEVARLRRLLERAGLPTQMPALKFADLARIVARDKKTHREKLRFVVLRAIGEAFVADAVAPDLVEQVVRP